MQADVGALGLAGLGAFSNILAALSADNVAPLALIQMQQLGSIFLVDGPYAHQVPELLKQAVSTQIGRLSLSVGWRHGDAISHLADSAGGQAVSMIAVCLTALYSPTNYGGILSRLCSSLLPPSAPRSAVSQLADVATQIESKLATIGFGNVLAKQVHRVLDAYQHLGLQPPEHLLERPSAEIMVELFTSLSHLNKPGHIVRILGSRGTAYFLAIVLFLFPQKTTATVESFVIHHNEDQCIFIEISVDEQTRIQTEHNVRKDETRVVPIQEAPAGYQRPARPVFQWEGWLTNMLLLEFGQYGILCDQLFRNAFCDLLLQLAPAYRASIQDLNACGTPLPSGGIPGIFRKICAPCNRKRLPSDS